MMSKLLNLVLGRRRQFYRFEIDIIEAVKAHLGVDAASTLQRQVDVVNKIQRHAKGKEVNLYAMRHGKPAFEDGLRFPDTSDEALLASVTLVRHHHSGTLKAEVWLVQGHFFSLVFSQQPKQFFADKTLEEAQAEIADVKVWFDPMRPRPADAEPILDGSTLTGWLRQQWTEGHVTDLRRPLPQLEREASLSRINAQLPRDYLEFIAQSEGGRFAGRCQVHGVTGIRQVVLPDDAYYILADADRGALGVRVGSQDAKLYILDFEDDDTRLVGEPFQGAMLSLLMLTH